MSGKFIEEERARLERELSAHIGRWPPPLRRATESILAGLAFRGDALPGGGWTGQFDSLTLLYPLFHAEMLGFAHTVERCRPWAVPHALYLIHSILSDRMIDQQVEVRAESLLYDNLALIHAEAMLHADAPRDFTWWRRLHHDYALHQASFVAGDAPCAEAPGANLTALEEAAHGRAALGFLATSAMLASAGCREEFISLAHGCFRAVVVALQWLDDMEDWPEDHQAGRPNLLLTVAEEERSSSVPGLMDRRPGSIERYLATSATTHAFGRARSLLLQAAAGFEALGGRLLARLIEMKLERVADREARLGEAWVSGLQREFVSFFPVLPAEAAAS